MKRTDLAKHKGKKIEGRIERAPARVAAPDIGRKEQRQRDRALGLVPFAVKLDAELAASLRTLAQDRDTDLSKLVGELLKKSIKAE
ncbi:MAG TPA: hypothetical protein VHB46_18765 [Burkholderiales bacterium]|nr:hypothetical protein [Burkholderiales bacterium]